MMQKDPFLMGLVAQIQVQKGPEEVKLISSWGFFRVFYGFFRLFLGFPSLVQQGLEENSLFQAFFLLSWVVPQQKNLIYLEKVKLASFPKEN